MPKCTQHRWCQRPVTSPVKVKVVAKLDPASMVPTRLTWPHQPGPIDLARLTWPDQPGSIELAQSAWPARPEPIDLAGASGGESGRAPRRQLLLMSQQSLVPPLYPTGWWKIVSNASPQSPLFSRSQAFRGLPYTRHTHKTHSTHNISLHSLSLYTHTRNTYTRFHTHLSTSHHHQTCRPRSQRSQHPDPGIQFRKTAPRASSGPTARRFVT